MSATIDIYNCIVLGLKFTIVGGRGFVLDPTGEPAILHEVPYLVLGERQRVEFDTQPDTI